MTSHEALGAAQAALADVQVFFYPVETSEAPYPIVNH